MGLEQDIHQKEFKNEHQKALINLLFTSNRLVNEMNAFFGSFDITRQQYNVLRILRGQHPKGVTVNLIKSRMLDKMSDASRIVQRLNTKGLVNRKVSGQDKRAVEITISPEGLKLLSETDNDVKGFAHLLESLSDDEALTLNLLLDKIRS